MATISQNQYDYLNNLVKAGGGNGEWAKAQLQGATVEAPNPTPAPSGSAGSSSNPFTPTVFKPVAYTPPSQSAPAPNYSTPSTPSYSAPSLGSQYSNVPGTNWQSTNPSNPNSSKYYADGSPVPSISYDNQQTGQHFSGYSTPQQFQSIINAGDAAAQSRAVSGLINSGSLISNDSIYKPMAASQGTPQPQTASAASYPSGGGVMTPQAAYSGSASGSPGMPSGGTDYAAIAAARTAAALAQKKTVADAQKTSLDQSYQRANQITQDNRTLENLQMDRTLNPFSGQSGYQKAVVGRERTLADETAQKNLLAAKGNVDQTLADYQNATAEQQASMADELQRADRAYQLQLAQFNQQAQNQAFNQNLQTQQFGQQQQNQAFNQGIQQAGVTGFYDPYASQKQQMQANSAAWFNASPAEKQRLAAENQSIGASIGAKQDANGNWAFPQAQPTVAAQQFAYQQARDAIKDKQYQQQFDRDTQQFGLDYALKQASLQNQITNDQAQRAIGYMNANTSAQNAANSASNASAQLEQSKSAQAQKIYQDTFNNLQSLYTAKDPYSGTISVTNPTALRSAIIAKNLPDDQTISLLTAFGLPINP